MYKIIQGGGVVRLADNAHIPPSGDNRDYAAYVDWVAQGNMAEVEDQDGKDQNRAV